MISVGLRTCKTLHYCEFSSSVALHSSLLSRKLNFYSDKLSGLSNTFLSSLAARHFASRSAFVHFQIPITLLLHIISSLHILCELGLYIPIYFPFSLLHYTLAVAIKIKPIFPTHCYFYTCYMYTCYYTCNSKANE